ncbi:MAG: hypothetical protein ACTSUF_03410 [Candidatus Heimdallarchaeaceae archaeon]
MAGFIKRLLGLFRKEKKPKIIYCGGMPSKKRRKHKRKPIAPEIFEPEIHIRGELFKKLGISYEKPKRQRGVKEVELSKVKEDKTEQILYNKWQPFIRLLEEQGTVYISKNEYYGSLRGKDIIRFAKKDLKRLGYKVDVKLRDYDGYISFNHD